MSHVTSRSTTGVVTVANGALLDYETAASHQIVVRTTDQGGLTFDKTFTIGLTNVNDAPTGAPARHRTSCRKGWKTPPPVKCGR